MTLIASFREGLRPPWRRAEPVFLETPPVPTHEGLPIRAPMTADENEAAMARYRLATSLSALAGNLFTALHPSSPIAAQERAPTILTQIEAMAARLRDGDESTMRSREAALFRRRSRSGP